MSMDPKSTAPSPATPGASYKGVKIFTYPKIIFLLPTFVAAILCGIGMLSFGDRTQDPRKAATTTTTAAVRADTPRPAASSPGTTTTTPSGTTTTTPSGTTTTTPAVKRFSSAQNVLGMTFLLIFALNLIIMAIDFPRFTVIALILLVAAFGFFILWLNVYFDLIPPVVAFLEGIYAVANAGFYFTLATIMLINFAIIWATRYLDYWEILPNEILHNHGPFSDLERYPTFNMKFDKEIPDILEYALLRSGRLVLHVANERKAIVLDNVLWIDTKENELKKLLSRMEVRVTTDQETAEPI